MVKNLFRALVLVLMMHRVRNPLTSSQWVILCDVEWTPCPWVDVLWVRHKRPKTQAWQEIQQCKWQFLFIHKKDQAGPINIQQLCRGQCDFGGGLHYRTVFARWAIQPPQTPQTPALLSPSPQQFSHQPAVLPLKLTLCLQQNLRWWWRECWTGNFYSGKRTLSPIWWVW